MRKLKTFPGAERFVGWAFALTHTLYVGTLIQHEFGLYFAGETDLQFHGLYLMGVNYPVAVLLSALGISYRPGDIWSYAVTDAAILVLGTAYWFAVGYSLAVISRHRVSCLLVQLRSGKWGLRRALAWILVILLFAGILNHFGYLDRVLWILQFPGVMVWTVGLPLLVLYVTIQRIRRHLPGS